MAAARSRARAALHDDALLMVPPPGYKFIPRWETICGKPGCFECFDIYCERCESKDRRIVELEMRNNDLVKYVTQLQGRIFSGQQPQHGASKAVADSRPMHTTTTSSAAPATAATTSASPFAYIQSPVLFDPNLGVSYVATTSFSPAPHEPPTGAQQQL